MLRSVSLSPPRTAAGPARRGRAFEPAGICSWDPPSASRGRLVQSRNDHAPIAVKAERTTSRSPVRKVLWRSEASVTEWTNPAALTEKLEYPTDAANEPVSRSRPRPDEATTKLDLGFASIGRHALPPDGVTLTWFTSLGSILCVTCYPTRIISCNIFAPDCSKTAGRARLAALAEVNG